jgi:hypothetical protein
MWVEYEVLSRGRLQWAGSHLFPERNLETVLTAHLAQASTGTPGVARIPARPDRYSDTVRHGAAPGSGLW